MPEDGPYGLRRGRTVADREAEREAREFGDSPIGREIGRVQGDIANLRNELAAANAELAAAKQEIENLKTWKERIHGENGIAVNGEVISKEVPPRFREETLDICDETTGDTYPLTVLIKC